MARPTIPGVLLVVALVLVPVSGTASKQPEPSTTPSRLPPLLHCGPAPEAPDGEFRANLFRVIPSAAAAAPTGYVTASLGSTDRDRAFARALCFGAENRSSSTGCRACLFAAARDATGGCSASRRAGVWRAGCFLSYADTDALSAREEEFRGWFYATTAATLEDRVCTGADDCDRCFEDAARAAAALPWLVRMRREVIVVGYSCSLRVQSYVLPIDTLDTRRFALSTLMLLTMVIQTGIVVALLLHVIVNLEGTYHEQPCYASCCMTVVAESDDE